MKRIIFGSILVIIVTCFLVLDVIEHNLSGLEILSYTIVWYGLLGWMVYSGIRSVRRKKIGERK